ncbi:MAG: hypothetical protein OXS30_08055 [Chloroflexota bacterium]|nr:hypothetical protein [Chloroflexota bacterium]
MTLRRMRSNWSERVAIRRKRLSPQQRHSPTYPIPHERGDHTAPFTAAAATEAGHALTLKAPEATALTALD